MPPQPLESLEPRTLLSITLDNSTLRITERGQNRDSIRVTRDQSQLVVTVNSRTRRFAASDVNRLVIDSGAGNDRINLKGLRLRATIYAGSGKDTLTGGRADDLLFGEEGQDTLSGGPGDDFLNGGGGEDLLHGNAGDDHLEGHAENDTLFGDAGNDRLDAVDYLWKDRLDGGDGTDFALIDDGIPDPDDFDTDEDDFLSIEDLHEIDNPYLD